MALRSAYSAVRPSGARRGLVFDIRSYATHDGPGLRTTVFLKGCPLRCLWCCNPESHEHKPDLLWLKERCLGCGACLAACSRKALDSTPEGGKRIDLTACTRCGECAERCPGEALNLVGRWLTVGEVLAEVMKDTLCFEGSGGGLTLSGGEPLAQPEFVAELLWRYKHDEKGRHAAVETCGEADWRHFQKIADDVDLFLYDIKHLDPAEHRKLTGRGNDRILENARRLAQEGHDLVIRMPLLQGINDTESNLAATAEFIASLPGVDHLDLLPYHRLGEVKYQRMGMDYPLSGLPAWNPGRIQWVKEFMENKGLKVRIGG